jgi:hypothetical protein
MEAKARPPGMTPAHFEALVLGVVDITPVRHVFTPRHGSVMFYGEPKDEKQAHAALVLKL